MPTATTISEYALENLGSLPTTWTPAEECLSPATTQLYAALHEGAPHIPVLFDNCDGSTALNEACFPSASEAGEIVTASDADHLPGLHILYFSPAPACPSDWITVGLAAKDDDGSIATSSGIYNPFSTSTIDASETGEIPNPPGNAFMHALDPGETVAACCPSGFSAEIMGPCYSTLSADAWTATEGCAAQGRQQNAMTTATFSLYGEEVSGVRIIPTAQEDQSTFTETASGSLDFELIPATSVHMITIVYQSADATDSAGNDDEDEDDNDEGGSGESGDGEDGEDEEGEEESAADASGAGGVAIAVCAAAGLLGAILAVPL